MTTQNSVFISYRREPSKYLAHLLESELRQRGYDVFLDVMNLSGGKFEKAVFDNIASRTFFLILLEKDTLERINEKKDWVRREIEFAMDNERLIVPVFVDDFKASDARKYLKTRKIIKLLDYQAAEIRAGKLLYKYIDELCSNYLVIKENSPILIPLSQESIEITKGIEHLTKQLAKSTESQLRAEQINRFGIGLSNNKQFEKAVKEFTSAINLEPKLAAAYNNRANAYKELGQMDKALEDYNKALEFIQHDAAMYSNRGLALVENNQVQYGLIDLNKAIDLNPQFSIAYYNRGIAYHHLRELDLAITDFTTAIEKTPDYANAYNNRGACLYAQDKIDLALADLDKAIRIEPNYTDAYKNRGFCYAKLGNNIRAMEDFDRAIILDSKNLDWFCHRGDDDVLNKRYESAILNYTIVLKHQEHAEAYNHRGVAYYNLLDFEPAIKDYSKAVEIKPDFPEAYNNLGEVYFAIQDFQKSFDNFAIALELRANYIISQAGFAIACYALNRIEDAKQLWKDLLKSDENHNNLDWLRQQYNWHESLIEEARKLLTELGK